MAHVLIFRFVAHSGVPVTGSSDTLLLVVGAGGWRGFGLAVWGASIVHRALFGFL